MTLKSLRIRTKLLLGCAPLAATRDDRRGLKQSGASGASLSEQARAAAAQSLEQQAMCRLQIIAKFKT